MIISDAANEDHSGNSTSMLISRVVGGGGARDGTRDGWLFAAACGENGEGITDQIVVVPHAVTAIWF